MTNAPKIKVQTPFFTAKLLPIAVTKQQAGMVAEVEIVPFMFLEVVASVTTIPRNFSTRFMIPACTILVHPQTGLLRIPFGEQSQFDILIEGANKRVQFAHYGFEFYSDDRGDEPEAWLLNSGEYTIWQ